MAVVSALIIGAAVLAGAAVAAFVATALVPKPKSETQSVDAGTTVQRRRSDREKVELLIGERIVGGVALYDNSYGGSQKEFFTWVTALSVRPCSGFVDLYVNGTRATLSGDPTTGEVYLTNPEFRGKNSEPRCWVRLFLGDDNSGLGPYLHGKFPNDFATTDTGGQMCVAVFTAQATNDDLGDEDDPESKQGKSFIPLNSPPEMKWRLRGAKICDPRIAGSSYSDYSTYVYRTNAVLVDAQFDYGFWDGAPGHEALVAGNGYPEGLMDIEYVKAAADHADLMGYGVNGIIRSSSPADQEEIQKCMNATRIEAPGYIKTVPASFRQLWGTVDLENLGDAYIKEYNEDGLSTEVFNEIQGTYVEPLERFANKTLPIYSRPEWLLQDNHIPRFDKIPFNMVTSGSQGLTLLKQEIYISRATAKTEVADLPLRFLAVPVGDLIDLENTEIAALNGRRWVVESVGRNEDGLVDVGLRAWAGSEIMSLNTNDPVLDETFTQVERDLNFSDGVSVIAPSLVTTSTGAISLSVNPSNLYVNGSSSTGNVTASVDSGPSGATYSFAWDWAYGGSGISISSPSSSTTNFTKIGSQSRSGSARCIVTASTGETSSVSVSVVMDEAYDPGDFEGFDDFR